MSGGKKNMKLINDVKEFKVIYIILSCFDVWIVMLLIYHYFFYTCRLLVALHLLKCHMEQILEL